MAVVFDQAQHGVAQAVHIVGVDIVAGRTRDFGHCRTSRQYHRRTAGHGLQDRKTKALVARRKNQGPGPGHQLCQLFVRQVAQQAHMAAGQGLLQGVAELALLPTRHADDQQRITLAQGFRQLRVGLQGQGQVLARLQGADAEEVALRLQAMDCEVVFQLGVPA